MTKQTTKTPRTFKPKACAKCGTEFTPTSSQSKYCPPCRIEVKREQRREENRRYRENNPEKVRELKRKWQRNNPDHAAAIAGKGLAIARSDPSCIPSGFTLASTIPFYKRARELTRATGVQFHVDHIIPLARGGLHCPSNLQVITADENIAKGDKLPSELDNMPVQLDLELV